MRTRIIWIIFVIFIASIAGCGKSDDIKNIAQEKASVKIKPVEITTLEKMVKFSGRLEGRKDIMVFPQIPGTIEKIHVGVGDKVKFNQLLVRMNGETLDQTKAQYDAAKTTYSRTKALYEDSLIAPQSYDQAEAGYKAAKAGYKQVLDNTDLRAPFSGTIVGKYYNEHDVYAPGLRGILRLAKTDKLKLPIEIAAKDFPNLKKGMTARIFSDVYPDKMFEGTLGNISPGADPYTGLFSGEITLDNKNNNLPVGVFVEVGVITSTKDNAMIIPRSSVVNDSIVFVVDKGKASRRIIEIGIITSDIIEVISGLEITDTVVSKGAVGLKDGLEVYVVQEVEE
ncbi:efflux RND transporter periplasmic adaptor subunit [bacterium]|nr:efflux RND transporter periplasmic adaptor subunit [bacterium]